MSLIVPPGTRVVARRAVVIAETNVEQPNGSVGVIVNAPADATHAAVAPKSAPDGFFAGGF